MRVSDAFQVDACSGSAISAVSKPERSRNCAKVGDQMADRPDLAGEAVPLAQQPRQSEAAAVGDHRKVDGNGAGIAGGRGGQRLAVGIRLEQRRRLGRIGQ